MDYASPLATSRCSLTTEKLLGIDEDIPERAVWIRMLLVELNRMSSHLLFLATNGLDIGAVSMMIYGWREREIVLRFFQKVTGLRMNHNFIRPGGVAADLPAGWRDDVMELIDTITPRLVEYDTLMTDQPLASACRAPHLTCRRPGPRRHRGPILRSTGVPWDLRRDCPTHYDEVGVRRDRRSYGDCLTATPSGSTGPSRSHVRQIRPDARGHYRIQDKKITPPPPARRVDGG
jgi:NADH-quinone oxidoreductase subunit D